MAQPAAGAPSGGGATGATGGGGNFGSALQNASQNQQPAGGTPSPEAGTQAQIEANEIARQQAEATLFISTIYQAILNALRQIPR